MKSGNLSIERWHCGLFSPCFQAPLKGVTRVSPTPLSTLAQIRTKGTSSTVLSVVSVYHFPSSDSPWRWKPPSWIKFHTLDSQWLFDLWLPGRSLLERSLPHRWGEGRTANHNGWCNPCALAEFHTARKEARSCLPCGLLFQRRYLLCGGLRVEMRL